MVLVECGPLSLVHHLSSWCLVCVLRHKHCGKSLGIKLPLWLAQGLQSSLPWHETLEKFRFFEYQCNSLMAMGSDIGACL